MTEDKDREVSRERMISFVSNIFKVYGGAHRPSERDAVEAARSALESGARLVRDASLLAEAGSFRSATALSVLALEEFGKASLLKWQALRLIERDLGKDLMSHQRKQSVPAAFAVGKVVMAIIASENVSKLGHADEGEKSTEHPSSASDLMTAASDFLKQKDGTSAKVSNSMFVLGLLKSKNFNSLLTSASLERFKLSDELKFAGLYVAQASIFDSDDLEDQRAKGFYDLIKGYALKAQTAVGTPLIEQIIAALLYEISVALDRPRLQPADFVDSVARLGSFLAKLNDGETRSLAVA